MVVVVKLREKEFRKSFAVSTYEFERGEVFFTQLRLLSFRRFFSLAASSSSSPSSSLPMSHPPPTTLTACQSVSLPPSSSRLLPSACHPTPAAPLLSHPNNPLSLSIHSRTYFASYFIFIRFSPSLSLSLRVTPTRGSYLCLPYIYIYIYTHPSFASFEARTSFRIIFILSSAILVNAIPSIVPLIFSFSFSFSLLLFFRLNIPAGK